MTDFKYTRKIYNNFDEIYYRKRQNKKASFWNRYIDIPAVTSLLKDEVKNKKVLDLGCGTGILTSKLKRWGAHVCGLDISEKMIEIAIREFPGIPFYTGNAEKTNFNNNEFDIVSSSLMLHYFKDLNPLFAEINRILKKGGKFIFSFHHPLSEVITQNKKDQCLIKPYFHNRKYKWSMKEGLKLISYHHTFENIFENLFDNNFLTELLLEPKPLPKVKNIDRTSYNFTSRYPSFCALRVIKIK